MLPVNDILNKFDIFKKEYEANNFQVVIYGAGIGASGAINLLNKHGIPINCIIDRDESKQGKLYLEVPVLSLERAIRNLNGIEFRILIAAPKYELEIMEYLQEYIDKSKVYSFECDLYNLFILNISEYKQYLSKNSEEINSLHNKLFDDFSKKTLENVLKGRVSGELSYFRSVFTPKQYFCDGLIKLTEQEVILDVGASYGDTLKDIIKYTNNCFKKVYCFEPDERCLNELVKTKEELNLENVVIINKGAWNKSETLTFSSDLNGVSSKIVENQIEICKNSKDVYNIETVCIDEIIDEKVTFIKMDIEGAELKALQGAKRVICEHKPKLAICVYHRNEDLLEISKYLAALVPEYKLYLRHHGINGTDTVLYAIL